MKTSNKISSLVLLELTARTSLVHLGLLVTLLGFSQAKSLDQEFDRHFARGVQLQGQGDLQNARLSFEEALKLEPQRVDALANLGSVLAQLGDFEKAIAYYRKALAVRSELHLVRYHLGLAYFQAQRFELAQHELQRVLIAQPTNHQAQHLLGLSLLKQDKVSEGIVELGKVFSAEPQNLEVAYTLASAYITNQQLDKAQKLITKVLVHQKSAEAALVRGSYEIAMKHYPKAVEELTRAVELKPTLPSLHSNLGYAHLCIGNRKLAIQEFQAELADNPQDFNANTCLSWIYREDGRIEEAAVLLKRALDLKPTDTGLQFQLAALTQTQGQNEEAARLLERVITRKPDYTPAHVLLARLYFHLKRTADAKREREIIDRLNFEEQSREPFAAERQGRYTGVVLPPR
jgi:tetratricopeptide (TPR) repeat protein